MSSHDDALRPCSRVPPPSPQHLKPGHEASRSKRLAHHSFWLRDSANIFFNIRNRYKESPDYDGVAYGLSKASLVVYAQQAARKWPHLRMNAITPGWVPGIAKRA